MFVVNEVRGCCMVVTGLCTMCSCWSELLTVPDKTLVVGHMHTPCLTPHCVVCTVMWVTEGGATWEQ